MFRWTPLLNLRATFPTLLPFSLMPMVLQNRPATHHYSSFKHTRKCIPSKAVFDTSDNPNIRVNICGRKLMSKHTLIVQYGWRHRHVMFSVGDTGSCRSFPGFYLQSLLCIYYSYFYIQCIKFPPVLVRVQLGGINHVNYFYREKLRNLLTRYKVN